jgi:alpha-1,6-mannosyltransferase
VTDASRSMAYTFGARRDLAAWLGLCAAGAVLLTLAAAGPWIVRTQGYGVLVPALALSGLVTWAATKLAENLPARAALIVILGLALAMRLALVGEAPLLSTDVYRYVWDGRVQGAGINPYLFVPADPSLQALRDAAIFPHINRADYAVTAYPPLAQAFFVVVTRLGETVTTMRLAMVGCEIVTVALIIDLLRRLDLPLTAVVAYAWHPLAVWEIANNGHVDALMVALLMGGVWLLVRLRPLLGAIAIALAAVVKPYALVVLPAFWPSLRWRLPLAVAVTILICYLPYLGAGRGVFGFLASGYLSEEGFASGYGIWLVALARATFGPVPGLTAVYVTIAAAVMGCLALRIAWRPEAAPHRSIHDIALLLTAGLFFASPNYAWYFLALVPFLALGAGAPAWALTLGALLLYRPVFLPYNDLAWKTAATLPFLVALLVTMWPWRASAPGAWGRPGSRH